MYDLYVSLSAILLYEYLTSSLLLPGLFLKFCYYKQGCKVHAVGISLSSCPIVSLRKFLNEKFWQKNKGI